MALPPFSRDRGRVADYQLEVFHRTIIVLVFARAGVTQNFLRAKAKVLTRYALGHWDVALALAWGPPAGRKTEINNFPRKGHHSGRRLGWMAKFSKSEERENLATSALGHWKAPLTLPTLPEDRGRVGAPQAIFLVKDHRLEAQLGLNGQNFVKRRKGNLAKSTLGHWRPR